jgi:AcrR family transcriptional regulator
MARIPDHLDSLPQAGQPGTEATAIDGGPVAESAERGGSSAEAPKVRRILDAAASVFSRSGYSDGRMDDVAAEAGVSKGGLYLHFRSKEDLFDALVGHIVGLETRKLAAARAAEGTATERLVTFFHEYAADIARMEKLYPVFMEVYARAARHATVRQMLRRYVDGYVPELSALIAEGVEDGEFRDVDPDEVAIQMIALLEGLALLWGLLGDAAPLPDTADHAIRLMLDGLLASPAGASGGPGGER